MTEIFPELYSKSSRDICLGVDSTLCVILLTNKKPQPEVTSIFEFLNTKFDRKMERGAKFKFMWLNVEVEKAWGTLFQYDGSDKVVILNPGKRKRFTTHEGPIEKDNISNTLDTIVGGDARFARIPEIPVFEVRGE